MPTEHHPDQPESVSRSHITPRSLKNRATEDRSDLAHFARRTLVAMLLFATAYLLWSGIRVLLLTFAGVLFAIFLSALSDWVSRKTGRSRRVSLAIVILVVSVSAGSFIWLLGARVEEQASELVRQVPKSIQQIQAYLNSHAWGRELLEKAPEAVESFAQPGQLWRMTGIASGAAGLFFSAAVIVFVGIFGAAEPRIYKNGLTRLVPAKNRQRVADALDAVVFNLRSWLVGQAIMMIMIGVTTAIGLWLLGIPLAFMLGAMTGLLEVAPYIGAWLAAVPAALIAFQVGPSYALLTLGLFLGIHIFEGYVLSPLVQRRTMHLPPALALVAQVLLGDLLGVLGLFVAAPLTVSIITFIKIFYVRDALGDESMDVPGMPSRDRAGAVSLADE
jgi:predicted PurR-regulated permease PerM